MARIWLAVMIVVAAMPSWAQDGASVRLERVAPARWQATYTFPRPVESLRFIRAAANHRERVWTVVTPGYVWARDSATQVLRLASDGQPTTTITLEFPQFTDPLPKEYELFQPFSDGSVALYTGHFYARPTGPGYPDDVAAVQHIELATPSNMHAVVRGRIDSGTVIFADSIGDGTYIYVGRVAPIETPHLVAILDPGMPAWAREMFDRQLPRLFAAYARDFATSLPWKPVVLYSFHDTATTGYSSGGGTLTGLINMTLTGRDWRNPSPQAAAQAFYLLAHESAHLWNGQLVESQGGAGSWMHEGSADALANDMLLEFGIIDREEWRGRRENALNQCAGQVTEASLENAARRGQFRTYYDCGFVLAMWTDALVKRARAEASLASFWRDFVAAARTAGGRYDEELYFAQLGRAGVPDSAIGAMRAFRSAADIASVVRAMRSAGVDIAEGNSKPPRDARDALTRRALAHVMAAACGRYSFNSGTPIVSLPIADCAPFRTSLRVYAIEGFSVHDQGHLIYDAVATACAAHRPVALQGQASERLATIPCTRALAPRPAWYRLNE